MRSHAKAATAGSNLRQGRGLGRIFRGVDATRGSSPDAKGSGAPSRRRRRLALAAAMVSLVVLSVTASSAGAVEFEFKSAFGPDGTNSTGFPAGGSVAVDQGEEVVYVLDRGANALFKFDLEGNPVNFGGSSPDITGNKLSGLSIGGGLGSRQVAVDAATHTIYLTGGKVSENATALQAFQSNGEPSLFTTGPGAGTNEISGFFGLRGVTVDTSGNIYVAGVKEGVSGGDINVYRRSGALLLESAGGTIGGPANIAVDTNGVLYVLRNSVKVERYTPSEYPITSTTTYALAPDLVDPHSALSVAVDPLTNRLYVVEFFEDEGSFTSQVALFSESGTPEGTFAGPGESGELGLPEGIAVGNIELAGIEGPIAQPFVFDHPEGGLTQVKIFREELVVGSPTVEATAVDSVTGDSAELRATINPNNRDTTYWFEYGPADCEVSLCAKVPIAGSSIGHGRVGVTVKQLVTGLEAETLYHYRVVAKNGLDSTPGPSKTLTTQSFVFGGGLADSRNWEMVSPAHKFGGTLSFTSQAAIQASAAGDALVYSSRGPIVERPTSNRLVDLATVLAKRHGAGEWASEDLTPPHTAATPVDFGTPFKVFTPDLSRAEMEPTDNTPLSPDASEQTPYLWTDGQPPQFDPMVNPLNVPSGTEFGVKPGGGNDPIRIEGASSDLAHVVIRSEEVPLTEDGVPRAIYMWSNGSLEAISKLPEAEGGEVVVGMLGSGLGSVRHAVSNNGSRVFWTPDLGYGVAATTLPALFVRDTATGVSTRLDIPSGGSGAGAERPVFNAASADGRVVFFTDPQQLTADASPGGRDLYRCEVGTVGIGLGCVELTDISAPIAESGESAEVLDQVAAISDDGTRLYFVARGVLDDEPNGEGAVAISGQPNLYYWHEGEGVRFIATLSERDHFVWGGIPGQHGFAERISAEASPNGKYFAFTSEQSLTGIENVNSQGERNSEAFVYNADANGGQLTCVSCAPSGAAAVGDRHPADERFRPQDPAYLWGNRWVAATLPEASRTEGQIGRSLYRPRTVLDNGRVFFNAFDPLVPADSNGNWDVYQYEPLGVGSCTPATSTALTTTLGGGCVGLLSSGSAAAPAGFLDASTSGDDVFFVTTGRLSVSDEDEEMDAYDARVDGIPATLTPNTECLGEACQPAANAPNDPTPASAGFRGEGNVKPNVRKRCAKGKRQVRQGGKSRCVARKAKKHKRAGKSGRAGR